jgi:hypothetical protein
MSVERWLNVVLWTLLATTATCMTEELGTVGTVELDRSPSLQCMTSPLERDYTPVTRCVAHSVICQSRVHFQPTVFPSPYTFKRRRENVEATLRLETGMSRRDRKKCSVESVNGSMKHRCCTDGCNKNLGWTLQRRCFIWVLFGLDSMFLCSPSSASLCAGSDSAHTGIERIEPDGRRTCPFGCATLFPQLLRAGGRRSFTRHVHCLSAKGNEAASPTPLPGPKRCYL